MSDNKGGRIVNIGKRIKIAGDIGFSGMATNSYMIVGDGHKNLLTIRPDGSVAGELEDMSEAAAIFVREVRRQLQIPAPEVGGDNTETQLYAKEAAGDAMIADYLGGVGLDGGDGQIPAQTAVDIAYGAVKAYRVGSADPALRLPHPRSLTPKEQ